MQELTNIASLWNAEQLPIRDALHVHDGRSYSVALDRSKDSGLEITGRFSLDDFLHEDPDFLADIMTTQKIATSFQPGFLCCGEGSHGSDGFFARLNNNEDLVWVAFFEDSNPFRQISQHQEQATFTSTSGVTVTVHLDEPERWMG